jgi:hypothetical protein
MSAGDASPAQAKPAPLARIPFTAQDEASIRALANWMQIAAVVAIVSAILKVVSAFVPQTDLGKLIDAGITFLIGLWVYQAATAFRRVAITDEADQHHLMTGFRLLRRVFLLQSILLIIVLTFLVIAMIVMALILATGTGVP